MKKILFLILVLSFSFSLINLAQAATAQPLEGFELNVPIGELTEVSANNALFEYFDAWYKFVLGSIGIIAVVVIMWAGFKWLTSQGNAGVIQDSKEKITSAIIGVFLAFASYAILGLFNPRLLEMKLPVMDQINASDPFEPQGQDIALTSADHPLNQSLQNSRVDRLTDGSWLLGRTGIDVVDGVRLDGIDERMINMVETIQTDFDASQYYDNPIVITSGYRPGSGDSQHNFGRAIDMARSDDFNQFVRDEIIGNTQPSFYYNGQPGYNVTYHDTPLTVIDEPINNCWHFDVRGLASQGSRRSY